jgi:hypothetical protein
MIALFACVSLPLVNLGLEVEVEVGVGFGPSDLVGVIAVLRGDLDLDLGGDLQGVVGGVRVGRMVGLVSWVGEDIFVQVTRSDKTGRVGCCVRRFWKIRGFVQRVPPLGSSEDKRVEDDTTSQNPLDESHGHIHPLATRR